MYEIQVLDEHGIWSADGLGDGTEFDSQTDAEAAVEALIDLGPEWADAAYRVVDLESGAIVTEWEETALGLTFEKWLKEAGRSDSASTHDLRAAWRAGEDPQEYRQRSEAAAKMGSATSEAKAAAARENGRKGGRPLKVKTVRVIADEENGCEQCWTSLRETAPEIAERIDFHEPTEIPAALWKQFRGCDHEPPEYAKSILLRVK